jgi:hypothetical protein
MSLAAFLKWGFMVAIPLGIAVGGWLGLRNR